ncbi:MAG: GGDEF domain-containing protein [Pseudomonadota bacterium]
MDTFYQLLSPLIFTAFAVAFVVVYRIQRHKAILLIAVSYLYGVAGFLIDIVHHALPYQWGPLFSSIVYAAGSAILASGIQYYYSNQMHPKRLTAAVLVHLSILGILMYIGDPWLRSFFTATGTALIFAIGIFGIQRHLRTIFDRALFAICMLCIAQNIARPIIIAALTAGPLTSENYDHQTYILVLHLCVAACAICLALTLLMVFVRQALIDKQQPSSVDQLTGLINHRGLHETISKLFSSDYHEQISVLLLNVDRFAWINEKHGNIVGDSVLKSVSRILDLHRSNEFLPARIGGEKFAIILVQKDLNEATEIAETIRREIAALQIKDNSERLFVTSSIGVSERRNNELFADTIGRADDALYAAKAKGRNVVSNETTLMDSDWMDRIAVHERRRGRLKMLPS